MRGSEIRKRKALTELHSAQTRLSDVKNNKENIEFKLEREKKNQLLPYEQQMNKLLYERNKQLQQIEDEKNKKLKQIEDDHSKILSPLKQNIEEEALNCTNKHEMFDWHNQNSNPFFQMFEAILFDCEDLVFIVLSYCNVEYCHECQILVPTLSGCMQCLDNNRDPKTIEWILSDFATKSKNSYIFQNCNDQEIMDEITNVFNPYIAFKKKVLDGGTILEIAYESETDSELESDQEEEEGEEIYKRRMHMCLRQKFCKKTPHIQKNESSCNCL